MISEKGLRSLNANSKLVSFIGKPSLSIPVQGGQLLSVLDRVPGVRHQGLAEDQAPVQRAHPLRGAHGQPQEVSLGQEEVQRQEQPQQERRRQEEQVQGQGHLLQAWAEGRGQEVERVKKRSLLQEAFKKGLREKVLIDLSHFKGGGSSNCLTTATALHHN